MDLKACQLIVDGRLGKTTAEKIGRVIPISRFLRDDLLTWKRTDGWLIPSNREGAHARVARQRDMMRAWARAGIRDAAWKKASQKAFRRGLQSRLKELGADDEAVKYLVGHDIGTRASYIDPVRLPLKETVALIPRYEPPTGANVVALVARRRKGANPP